MLKHLAILSALFVLGGCTSLGTLSRQALVIRDVDWPLMEIKQVIQQLMPAGQRAVSPNGREMLSRHFIMDGRNFVPAGDATERWYAQFLILGDRRPYDVEVLVTKEKRVLSGNQFVYKVAGADMRLAKELERRLRAELTKRREDRNIIDDFRVF